MEGGGGSTKFNKLTDDKKEGVKIEWKFDLKFLLCYLNKKVVNSKYV